MIKEDAKTKLTQTVRQLANKKEGFYFAIDFKDDCFYHESMKTGKSNFQRIEKISQDISSRLSTRMNRFMRYVNQEEMKLAEQNNRIFNKYIIDESEFGIESRLYKSMDDIFENGIVTTTLDYNYHLQFIGVIEFSKCLFDKKLINQPLSTDFELGTHVHLFVSNNTGLSNQKIIDHMFYKEDLWTQGIKRVTPPKDWKSRIYDLDPFINYHAKQPFLNKRIVQSRHFWI